MRALDYNYMNVSALCSHLHNDHAFCLCAAIANGIDVYATKGTHEAKGTLGRGRAKVIKAGTYYDIDEFRVLPFESVHDGLDAVNFLIFHPECGNVLFVTDTHYIPYNFESLNQIIIETNFCEDIIDQKLDNGSINYNLRERILNSHHSIQAATEFLQRNNTSAVRNIVLIHLSDSNSDAAGFKQKIETLTGKPVFVADKDQTIDFNLTPF